MLIQLRIKTENHSELAHCDKGVKETSHKNSPYLKYNTVKTRSFPHKDVCPLHSSCLSALLLRVTLASDTTAEPI
jgi:hypothetical protein